MKTILFGVLPTALYFGIAISLSNLGHFAIADTMLYVSLGAIVLITVFVVFANIPGGIYYRKRKQKLKELDEKIQTLEKQINKSKADD